MNKPAPQPRKPILLYAECEKWIGEKLGYDIRDTLGSMELVSREECEYRDYWHFLCDQMEVHNGSEITIGSDLLGCGTDWQDEITRAFIAEFGDGAEYWVEW